MIARIWYGWTSEQNADLYQAFLHTKFFPAAEKIPGFCGAKLLRRDMAREIEFMTIIYFESMDTIRAFAGKDVEAARIAPEARQLLSRAEERVSHYIVTEPS